jgi:hypothetical protein
MPFIDYLTTFFAVTMIISVVAWIIFGVYWFLRYLGVYRWFALRKIKKSLKDYEVEDRILLLCAPLVWNSWSYSDLKRYVKYHPASDRNKIIYTCLMLYELPREELKSLAERGMKLDGNITRQSIEARSIAEKAGSSNGGKGKKPEYYREGKTSHYVNG